MIKNPWFIFSLQSNIIFMNLLVNLVSWVVLGLSSLLFFWFLVIYLKFGSIDQNFPKRQLRLARKALHLFRKWSSSSIFISLGQYLQTRCAMARPLYLPRSILRLWLLILILVKCIYVVFLEKLVRKLNSRQMLSKDQQNRNTTFPPVPLHTCPPKLLNPANGLLSAILPYHYPG